MRTVGKRIWAIAEGHIPSQSLSQDRAFESHETACILNSGTSDAHVTITIFLSDREPIGFYHARVPENRTLNLRFNGLHDPETIPRDTDYSSLFESDVPAVIQHTRLDPRMAEIALLTTPPYSQD